MTETTAISDSKQYTYYDLIRIFLLNKKKIVLITLLSGILAALVVYFAMDPIFYSSATLKTTSKSSGISSLMGIEGVPDIGELSGLGGGSTVKELALYENILMSRRCVEAAIVSFNILEEEKFKYMFDAVKYFRQTVMQVTKDKVAGTLEVGIYDKDPAKAKDMVEFMVNQLNSINTELNVLNARNNREFIEGRYELAKQELSSKEDSLRDYQDRFGIAPDLQVQAAVKAEIELESEIRSEEIKLEILKKILAPDESEIKIQNQKIEELSRQLSNIQNNGDDTDVLTLKGKPEIVLNYLRLKRNVEIQNKILTTLIPLLEQARIEEKRETPSVLVLDPPAVPDKKVKPKRAITVLILMFITGVMTFLYFILKDKWRYVKLNISK